MAGKKQTISVKKEEEQQIKFMKKIYLFLGIGCVLYYVFPYVLWIAFAGKENAFGTIMQVMLVGVYPFYPFIACFISTRYHGFKWFLPVMFGGYYLPAALILLGIGAAPYALVYVAFGYFGCLGGFMTVRRIERQKLKKEKARNEKKGKKASGYRGKKS